MLIFRHLLWDFCVFPLLICVSLLPCCRFLDTFCNFASLFLLVSCIFRNRVILWRLCVFFYSFFVSALSLRRLCLFFTHFVTLGILSVTFHSFSSSLVILCFCRFVFVFFVGTTVFLCCRFDILSHFWVDYLTCFLFYDSFYTLWTCWVIFLDLLHNFEATLTEVSLLIILYNRSCLFRPMLLPESPFYFTVMSCCFCFITILFSFEAIWHSIFFFC